MSGIATAIGGAAVIGAIATNNASRTQANAANNANNTQLYMYDQTRADQAPWRDAGVTALDDIKHGYEAGDFSRDFSMRDFTADPGYKFRMQEGMKALQASAASRGSLNSGATLKELSRYSQDYAANEYQNAYNRYNADRDRRFNRLSALAGIGQTATSQVGQAGQNYANQYGQNVMGAANTSAAAQMAQANNLSNLVGLGIGAYGGAHGWYNNSSQLPAPGGLRVGG